jgi:hypothetical protein
MFTFFSIQQLVCCCFGLRRTCCFSLLLQLPARVQQLAATANAVLFDFDRHNSYQFQSLRQSLHEAIGKGKTMPLRPHMHRYRWVTGCSK